MFQEDGIYVLSIILLQRTTKIHDIICKANIGRLWKVERMLIGQETQDPRTHIVVTSRAFISPHISHNWSRRNQQPRNANKNRQERPQQKPFLSGQRTRKVAAQKEHFLTKTIIFQQNATEKKMWPHPYPHQLRLSGEPGLPPSLVCSKDP